MTGVNVRSEIGTLRKVLLHRPGRELLNLTPDTLEELLFDDIPFLRVAQAEHDAFADALRGRGVEVVYLEDLAADVIGASDARRDAFLAQWAEEAGIAEPRLREAVIQHILDTCGTPKDVILKTMEGVNLAELPAREAKGLADLVGDPTRMVANPMPNLYFTRDPFAMIGRGASLNRMYSVTRNRETIYGEMIFAEHPELAGTPLYYSRHAASHIEGGDILNINATTLAVGISQRTQAAAIDELARRVFSDETSSIETILAFDIPNSRAFMHLDTVFTQIDHDKFTIHPGIMGPLTVYEITKDGEGFRVVEVDSTLEEVLTRHVGREVTLIPCGGGDRIAAEREQWNDGSNTLCIAPGSIVVYERNDVTNALLKDIGLDVIEIPSAELSRGRGGPRCMSMPVWRDDL